MKNLTVYKILIGLMIVVSLGSCRDQCRKIDCNDQGFCYEGECLCEKWYSGEECELAFNRNYAGTYYGQETYENGAGTRQVDSLTLEASETIPNRLAEPDGFFLLLETDSTLDIPYQRIIKDDDTIWIEGQGSHEVGLIFIQFTSYQSNEDRQEENPDGFYEFSGSLFEREE